MTHAEPAELQRAVDRLVGRVAHWTPARWTKPASDTGISRAERVHELVQRLADAAADAEGSPRRAVPRLDNDLALTDQLRVVTADVLAASGARPDMLADLASAVRATSSTLD
ncbi:MAG TPA: hypothetical protein VE132_00440 [Micromonosporaceae bacterium]|nr:hypothetical protein [Micromonosporaceae bacterium]